MKNSYYLWFQIVITASVALVYLSGTLKEYLTDNIYNFLVLHRDFIIGCYYCYLAFELYMSGTNIQLNA